QRICSGNAEIAQKIAENVTLRGFNTGDILIKQGEWETDLLFILMGNVEIQVHGRAVNTRRAGEHVGEMAAIDVSKPRSATVIARSPGCAAVLPQIPLNRISNEHPHIWRELAIEAADRLRQRSDLVAPRNYLPHVFIGSSGASIPIAAEVQKLIQS